MFNPSVTLIRQVEIITKIKRHYRSDFTHKLFMLLTD